MNRQTLLRTLDGALDRFLVQIALLPVHLVYLVNFVNLVIKCWDREVWAAAPRNSVSGWFLTKDSPA